MLLGFPANNMMANAQEGADSRFVFFFTPRRGRRVVEGEQGRSGLLQNTNKIFLSS